MVDADADVDVDVEVEVAPLVEDDDEEEGGGAGRVADDDGAVVVGSSSPPVGAYTCGSNDIRFAYGVCVLCVRVCVCAKVRGMCL